jgi:cytosine/adenosine deaminase-related metal-dependent hydrolase
MMTLGGARAAGLQHLIGSLAPGKRADIVIRSVSAAELMPGFDPAHQLVAIGHGPTADTVLVNGKVVMRGGHATLVDETGIFAKARTSIQRMMQKLGLNPSGLWPRAQAA